MPRFYHISLKNPSFGSKILETSLSRKQNVLSFWYPKLRIPNVIIFTLLSNWYLNRLISFFKASLSPEKSSFILTIDLINLARLANFNVDKVSLY